jgi:hypothetical protein
MCGYAVLLFFLNKFFLLRKTWHYQVEVLALQPLWNLHMFCGPLVLKKIWRIPLFDLELGGLLPRLKLTTPLKSVSIKSPNFEK